MIDHKTLLEKWKDFWFWFDATEVIYLSIAAGILMLSVSSSLSILRLVGLI